MRRLVIDASIPVVRNLSSEGSSPLKVKVEYSSAKFGALSLVSRRRGFEQGNFETMQGLMVSLGQIG